VDVYIRNAFLAMRAEQQRRGTHDYFYEMDVCGRSTACRMERLGLLVRFPGAGGRPTTVRLTPTGLEVLGALPEDE
jgi:hypothetical protein